MAIWMEQMVVFEQYTWVDEEIDRDFFACNNDTNRMNLYKSQGIFVLNQMTEV